MSSANLHRPASRLPGQQSEHLLGSVSLHFRRSPVASSVSPSPWSPLCRRCTPMAHVRAPRGGGSRRRSAAAPVCLTSSGPVCAGLPHALGPGACHVPEDYSCVTLSRDPTFTDSHGSPAPAAHLHQRQPHSTNSSAALGRAEGSHGARRRRMLQVAPG